MVENLNRRLKHCTSDEFLPIDSASFSIAMSGTEARLYISLKQKDPDYYMVSVKSFVQQDPEH